MSFPFSFGDFIALGQLLTTTVRKCQAASKGFQELSRILPTIWLCVESARSTLEGTFNQLPAMHQNAVASALIGLRNLGRDLNSELDRYAAITPGEFQLVKLRFALLADPRSTESKLTLHLSMLNTCMAIIIWFVEIWDRRVGLVIWLSIYSDSMTRSNLQPYNITNLVGGSNHQAAPQLTQDGNPSPSSPSQSNGSLWQALAVRRTNLFQGRL